MSSRRLTIQRLAQQVIRNRDQEAAIVLGDHQQSIRAPYIETGRTRPARFEIMRAVVPLHQMISNREYEILDLTMRNVGPLLGPRTPIQFWVLARERIYNLDLFAASPGKEHWRSVFAQWETSTRAIYQGLVRYGLLPRTIRFREILWRDYQGQWIGETVLIKHLILQRTPQGRDRPVEASLMIVRRADTPETAEIYPGRP